LELNVILASNVVRDERFGGSKVPLRIAAELEALGVQVTTLFASDLPRVPHPKLSLVSSPFRMARALAKVGPARDQIVDIAGWDAWLYARWARRKCPQQAIVARSNGLWCRGLPFKGGEGRSAGRRLVSKLVQGQLCRWERESIRAADLAIFGTHSDADYAIERGWISPERIAVINPAVDDEFASDVPLDARAGLFYVGSYHHQKGGDAAADAAALVMARRSDVTATFVGPGVPPAEILGRFAPESRARVRVLDKLPARDVARELRGGAILLWPALYEGFGMVVLEAMRAGLVVIATRTGAGAEIIRDGENGLNVPFGDLPATAAAIERLVADPGLRIRLATTALNETRGRTWRAAATRLAETYRTALDVAGRTRSARS